MKARSSVIFVVALVMVLSLLQAPAAFAQDRRDPNEGEPKHEINELQNKLHHTDDPSKENHLEGKIDALQNQAQTGDRTIIVTDPGSGAMVVVNLPPRK